MPDSYIPPKDADLEAFATTLAATLTVDPTAYGLVAGDATVLTNATNAFASALDDSNALQAAASAGVANKNTLRDALIAAIRPRVAQIQADPAVTPMLLEAAGLPVHDDVHSSTAPMMPATLACTPLGNGFNHLTWDRNGNLPNTSFDVEAKRGTATAYTLAASVTASKYDDPSPNGASVCYRVKARRGKLVSMPSNEAMAS